MLRGRQRSTEAGEALQTDTSILLEVLLMTYDEVLTQVLELLQRDQRVAYRVLKRRFGLDDAYVDDLKADLIKAKRLAIDEDGEVLVWAGHPAAVSSQLSVTSPNTSHPAPKRQLNLRSRRWRNGRPVPQLPDVACVSEPRRIRSHPSPGNDRDHRRTKLR